VPVIFTTLNASVFYKDSVRTAQ